MHSIVWAYVLSPKSRIIACFRRVNARPILAIWVLCMFDKRMNFPRRVGVELDVELNALNLNLAEHYLTSSVLLCLLCSFDVARVAGIVSDTDGIYVIAFTQALVIVRQTVTQRIGLRDSKNTVSCISWFVFPA